MNDDTDLLLDDHDLHLSHEIKVTELMPESKSNDLGFTFAVDKVAEEAVVQSPENVYGLRQIQKPSGIGMGSSKIGAGSFGERHQETIDSLTKPPVPVSSFKQRLMQSKNTREV